jgi:hypothetical protein
MFLKLCFPKLFRRGVKIFALELKPRPYPHQVCTKLAQNMQDLERKRVRALSSLKAIHKPFKNG